MPGQCDRGTGEPLSWLRFERPDPLECQGDGFAEDTCKKYVPPPEKTRKRGFDVGKQAPSPEYNRIGMPNCPKSSIPRSEKRPHSCRKTWHFLLSGGICGKHRPFNLRESGKETLPEEFVPQIPHAVITNKHAAHWGNYTGNPGLLLLYNRRFFGRSLVTGHQELSSCGEPLAQACGLAVATTQEEELRAANLRELLHFDFLDVR